MADKQTLKSWFKTAMKPTWAQFAEWMDSYWHKDEAIPATNISGLQELFNANTGVTENQLNDSLAAHDADPEAHPPIQARIDDIGTAEQFVESFNQVQTQE